MQPRRARRLVLLTAAAVLGFTVIGVSGCGPLGLYSLAHSLMIHHVLKPVVVDEPMPAVDTTAEQFYQENVSSRSPTEPIDTSRSNNFLGDKACDD